MYTFTDRSSFFSGNFGRTVSIESPAEFIIEEVETLDREHMVSAGCSGCGNCSKADDSIGTRFASSILQTEFLIEEIDVLDSPEAGGSCGGCRGCTGCKN